MGIKFSPGCECCGNVLLWFNTLGDIENTHYVVIIPFGQLYGYYTATRGLRVDTAVSDFSGNSIGIPPGYPIENSYSGDINNYKLVFWICPMRDTIPVWWPVVQSGNFSGRIVIVTEYSLYADNPLQDFLYSHIDFNYYNNIFAPFTGLRYIPKIITTNGTVEPDKLMNGVASPLKFGTTAWVSGGITLSKTMDNSGAGGEASSLSRNTVGNTDFVLSGDSNVFIYNFDNVNPFKSQLLDNLWDVAV